MHTIKCIATIGEHQFIYTAVMPFKSGWQHWDLYVGDLFQGQLVYQCGQWRAFLVRPTKKNAPSWLTTEDIQVFIAEIEKQKT